MNHLMEAFTFDCKHDGEVGTRFLMRLVLTTLKNRENYPHGRRLIVIALGGGIV